MSDARFYDPAVLKVVRAVVVSRGIRAEPDLEDAIGAVVLACIEYVRRTGRPPEDVGQATAIARRIAQRYSVDEVRKRVLRGKRNVSNTWDVDEPAHGRLPSLDPVDQKRMLEAIRQVLKDDQIEALSDVGAGVTQAELAAERGAAKATMRKRTQAAREKAAGALDAKGYWVAGGFAALLAGVAAVWAVAFREPQVAHWRPEQAAKERGMAAEACKERRWDECERALDRASRLDPEGDRGAEVQGLRAAIAAGRLGAGEGRAEEGAAPEEGGKLR